MADTTTRQGGALDDTLAAMRAEMDGVRRQNGELLAANVRFEARAREGEAQARDAARRLVEAVERARRAEALAFDPATDRLSFAPELRERASAHG